MTSLKQRLHSYLLRNFPRVIPSGELQRLAMDAGYTPANAARRCRELENDGKVEVFYEKGCASYRAKKEMFIPEPKVEAMEIRQTKLI